MRLSEGRAHVQIRTAADGILSPDMTGLSEAIQAVNVTVVVDGQRTSHIVVRAVEPPFVVTSSMGAIHKLFPESVVSVVVTDAPGETTIACEEAQGVVAFGAAAAAATVKRAWGWDESAAIMVRIRPASVNIEIDAVADGDGWFAREIGEELGNSAP